MSLEGIGRREAMKQLATALAVVRALPHLTHNMEVASEQLPRNRISLVRSKVDRDLASPTPAAKNPEETQA